jgi:hypothetical protein
VRSQRAVIHEEKQLRFHPEHLMLTESGIVTNSETLVTTGKEEVIKETIWKFCEC